MAFSFVQFTGDGVTTNFAFAFPYLDKSHIVVRVNNVITTYSWVNSSTVQVSPAPLAGLIVDVRRATPITGQQVTFTNGSVENQTDLNNGNLQMLYAEQETSDFKATAVALAFDGTLDAQNLRVKNLATPINVNDGANKAYVDASYAASPAGHALEAHNDTVVRTQAAGDILAADFSQANKWNGFPVGNNLDTLEVDTSQNMKLRWRSLASKLFQLLTTKGDLLVSTGAATQRKAVGADGTVLKADSTQADGLVWSNPIGIDGARGLRVVPAEVIQGIWANGSTTFTAQASGFYNLGTVNVAGDGVLISSPTAFYALNMLVTSAGSGGSAAVVYEYWNGAAWTAFTPSAVFPYSVGYGQARWTTGLTPGWVVGGSGTNVPAGNFNLRVRITPAWTSTVAVGRISHATRVDVTADEVIASNGIQKAITQSLGTITPDITLAGPIANGRGQAGAFSANSYVYLWLIYNPSTTTWAGQWDVSATAPTLPAGYTFKVRLSAWRVDANSVLIPWEQYGKSVDYNVAFTDVNASSATTPTAVTLTVPPEATYANVSLYVPSSAGNRSSAYVGSVPFAVGTLSLVQGLIVAAVGATSITALQSVRPVRLKVAQTVYYAIENGSNVTLYTFGYTMPGNLH